MNLKIKRFAAVLAASVVLGSTATLAWAAIPDSTGVIHGCRNTLLHSVTVIDSATQSCPAGSTALNWNQTGPQGPVGATGAAGSTGPGSVLYGVSAGQAIVGGQTSVNLSVSCAGPSDVMVAGGYGFDMSAPAHPGAVAVPLDPAPLNVQILRSLMRRPGVLPIAQDYEFQASFDPYDGASSTAGVEVRAICASVTS